MNDRPIPKAPKRLRQRRRADGSWRIWWEPEGAIQALGFSTVELSADKPTWSAREAEKLNDDVDHARAGNGRQRATTGGRSIDALIHEFCRHSWFKDLRASTQRGMNTNLILIKEKWGTSMVSEFSKPVMFKWYETLTKQRGQSFANSIMRTMSRLFSFAETVIGWRPENSNPCFKIGLKAPPPRSRFATWEEFDQLLASADALDTPHMAVAIAMATLNGHRQYDLYQLQPEQFQMIENRLSFQFKRSKRGNFGAQPLHHIVADRIIPLLTDAIKARRDVVLFDLPTNQAFHPRIFNVRYCAIRDHAAKRQPSLADPKLEFRDLRRTFGVWTRAAGTSKADAADVLGNSAATNPQLGETYMPPSYHTSMRAIDAIKPPRS